MTQTPQTDMAQEKITKFYEEVKVDLAVELLETKELNKEFMTLQNENNDLFNLLQSNLSYCFKK